MKVRVAVSREARYGYRGQRVGEASHPGPMRRLRRSEDVRNVFPRLATQSREADSDDGKPLVRVPELHVRSSTEPRASGVVENGRRRVRREGSDFGSLTLIDSSDENSPFTVPARPPSRRVASVLEPEDPSPNPEGRDVAAGVGRQLSVDPTHMDSNSALQVEESVRDALEIAVTTRSACQLLATQVDSSGPGHLTRPLEGRDVRSRRDHRRGLSHDGVVDALELDLPVNDEFDPVEHIDEEAVAVPWEVVANRGNGRPPSRRLRCVRGRIAKFREHARRGSIDSGCHSCPQPSIHNSSIVHSSS